MEGEEESKVVQWHDVLWPLEALEESECEMKGDGWVACLPQNAEERPASQTGRAQADAAKRTSADADMVGASRTNSRQSKMRWKLARCHWRRSAQGERCTAAAGLEATVSRVAE